MKKLAATLLIGSTMVASACVIRESAPASGGGGGVAATGGAFSPTVVKNQAVKLVGLGPEDAFLPDQARIIGLECYADDTTTQKRDGYWAGPFTCGDQDFFFYQVSLAPGSLPARVNAGGGGVGGGLASSWPSSVPAVDPNWTETVSYIGIGTFVQVVGLSSEDAYKGNEGEHIGKVCRADSKLNNNGGGYFGGQVQCQDGASPYYFKAKMRILSR